ncbi:SHOCT domain-containing protein [Halobaculum marinum]|uniref:SHOCT domain-containing protein n=1 Tax=Halobaculum marinum TaxID=3031996 RepID=A0ABD5X059_9EURY|nr:SHOCT domain-containing protein [Halobaculum sp. DT55]
MSPSTDPFALPESLARFTPDSRRWRAGVAAACALGAVLSLYATLAVVSGVKSGAAYTALALLFAVLAVTLPAVASAVALAPASAYADGADGGGKGDGASEADDAVETLKRRYATGEIDEAEFDDRLDTLVELDAAAPHDAVNDGRSTTQNRLRKEAKTE